MGTQLAGTLSGGEQQMLAIARALMVSPEFLILDEPSLGLAPKVVSLVFKIIADLRRAGVTILLVEQNVKKSLAVADRAYVRRLLPMIEDDVRLELKERADEEALRLLSGRLALEIVRVPAAELGSGNSGPVCLPRADASHPHDVAAACR